MERLTFKVGGVNAFDDKNPLCTYGGIQKDGRTIYTGAVADKLAEYEDLEEQGKLPKLPCAVGDTVHVLAECENIPTQLDGTLYGKNGGPGTATGYYCPYEDNCPFDDEDFEDCEKYKGKTAVFEDTVGDITVGEDGIWIRTENCGVCSQIGLYIFLTMEEAEAALKQSERGKGKEGEI